VSPAAFAPLGQLGTFGPDARVGAVAGVDACLVGRTGEQGFEAVLDPLVVPGAVPPESRPDFGVEENVPHSRRPPASTTTSMQTLQARDGSGRAHRTASLGLAGHPRAEPMGEPSESGCSANPVYGSVINGWTAAVRGGVAPVYYVRPCGR
jgi:hypothetical protein